MNFKAEEKNNKFLDFLEERVKELGGCLKINDFIDIDHQDSLWYGGSVAEIKYKGYTFDISATGDVYATLLNSDGEEIAYVKDKNNSAAFYGEMQSYIKNDKQLYKAQNSGRLILDHSNWWECFLTLPNGTFVDMMLSLDASTISEAIEEVAATMDEIISWQEDK